MAPLTDGQLADFQTAFDWRTGYALPDGRPLGVPGKRGDVARGVDPRVQAVVERFAPAGKRILEIGCCEGGHTVQLAAVCGEVVGLDVRPHNVAGALIRSFAHGVRNARFALADVRELGHEFGTFDIVFHVGVLYHLDDPAGHLARIAALAPDLILDTHYANDTLAWPEVTASHAGRHYAAKRYREGGWEDVFSGVQPTSTWLMRDDLLRLIGDVGYRTVEVIDDRNERNGPRLTLVARRPADPIERGLPAATDADGWKARAFALEGKLATVQSSLAWRIGRLLTAPLRRAG
ncbi:MAG: methyltransferase domain-containing protein [Gemmataceae bacterium]